MLRSGLLLLPLLILSSACRNLYEAQRPYEVYAKPISYFQPLLNQTASEEVLVLENPEYPIELKLFSDKTFHYYLARLGEGTGSWSYHPEGYIELYAERKIFVMRMQMHSVTPEQKVEAISLEFADRFGPKFLPLTRKK